MAQDGGTLTETIQNFAQHENCIVGICDTTPLPHNVGRFTPFVSQNILKRSDPAANLPGAKSIIVVGVEAKLENFPPMPGGAGVLSVLGVNPDYHVAVRALLKRLADELQKHTDFKYKILVDSSTLDERALAVRAGLGFLGRNGLVISREYGSRFNIGLLLTDIPWDRGTDSVSTPPLDSCSLVCAPLDMDVLLSPLIENDSNIKLVTEEPSPCHNCRKCISACPSGALSDSGEYNAARCISYLTQKDDLTPEEAALMGRHLYGCDVCQNACPFNRPQPPPWAMSEDWLTMSDDDFVNAYGHTAMLWRGVELLRRNARVASPATKSVSQGNLT